MSLATDIAKIVYVREAATGNLVASFNGVDVVLVAVRSGHPRHTNITSYTAVVDGVDCSGGNLLSAKLFAGLYLASVFTDVSEMPSCSPAGEPC